MQPTLIVAYGNPLRSDDGIGWHAAELLRRELSPLQARIVCLHQLSPELAEAASQADTVIFIDAACYGTPGQIVVSTLPQIMTAAFSHHLSPQNLMALCQELYGACPHSYTVSVAGRCFDHGDDLSPTLSDAVAGVVEAVRRLLISCPQ